MFNSSKRLLPHMFCLIVMFLLPGAIDAQDITLADVALAPDTVIEGRNQNDFLGYAVAISGDVLAIGIPQADATDKNAGAVEIWVRDGHLWSLEQTLVGPNREDAFGFSVALQGNILVIGAPYADSGGEKDVGQVHVFSREGTTWVPQQKIIGSESTGQFGQTVAFDSDTLVVGAPYAIAGGEKSAGLIYVYILDGGSWVLQQTISGLTKNDLLGWSIALSDDTLVAAAPLFDVGQNKDVGQAQVWTRTGTTWTYQQTLTGDVEDARFGWSVALDGDKLAVGVPYATIGEYGSAGIAQLYVRSGASWALQQTFAGLAADDLLGWSVTLKDGVLAVGAPQANPMGVDNAGASYVYSQVGSTWLLRYVVIGEQVEEQVGRRQAVGDSTLIIGDYWPILPRNEMRGESASSMESLHRPKMAATLTAPTSGSHPAHLQYISGATTFLMSTDSIIVMAQTEFLYKR
jgi:hypothetical protein